MEDRLGRAPARKPGAALAAFAAITAITLMWWALALWPAGDVEPEWLARTRAACFGSARDGLPDVGGWILLIGEPIGMLGVLGTLYGRSLRRDLQWIAARTWRMAATLSLAIPALLFLAILALRAAGVRPAGAETGAALVAPQRIDLAAPRVDLVDQDGRHVTLADLGGHTVLLTFAAGHCSTVCPAIVSNLLAARRNTHRPDVPLIILTIDPWRDTPDRLPTLARHWTLVGGDRVLSGDIADVNRALDALGIARRRDEMNGDIDHVAAAMIVREGRVAWRTDGAPGQLVSLLQRE